MNIALDFDGTYTEDPLLWDHFIQDCRIRGHHVRVVTFRHPEEKHGAMTWLHEAFGVPTIFTSRTAKRKFCVDHGINIDVWIDDQPELIIEGSDWTHEQYQKWRRENGFE